MYAICPNCNAQNRQGAKFCNSCGVQLAAVAPVAQPAPVQQQVAGAAQQARQAAAQAAQAAAPLAKAAAGKSLAASKRGMSFLARVVTGGGQAAYTEIVSPLPVAEGWVRGQPTADQAPAPLEWGAVAFVILALFGWPVFLLPQWWHIALVLMVVCLLLLALNFAGLRRPFFSRLTFGKLFRPKGQVPRLRFQLQDSAGGQVRDAIMIGQRSIGVLNQGAYIRVYGIPQGDRLRVWKMEALDQNWQPQLVITAPRLLPLTVALLAPAALMVIVGLLVLVLRAA